MEANPGFTPSQEQMDLLAKMFTMDETIIDPEYNNPSICLSEIEA